MRKLIVLFLTMILVLSAAACSAAQPQNTAPAPSGNTSPGTDAQPAQKYTMRLAHVLQEDTASHIALADGMKKYVEEQSKGQVTLELYPNGSLGGERQLIEAAQLGTLEMAYTTTAVLANFEPKFQVFDLPFLFNDIEIARAACDGELGDVVTKELPKVKLKSVVYGENGFRNVSNNKGGITAPSDMKGLKIRTMENAIHMKSFELIGANPTPMNFNELYTALQQGTVDAQENPVFLTYTSKFYEVQKYLTLTGHVYAPGIITTGNSYWESLPDDIRSIVTEGGKEFRDLQREILDQQNVDYLAKLKEAGMQVNELTPEQKQAFVDITKPIYNEVAKTIGQDLVDLAIKANETYKK